MRLVTAEEMRAVDQAAINDFGISGLVLMENAGLAVVRQAEKMLGGLNGKTVAIFCGGGNNGGDGLVAARHLFNRGCDVRLFYLTDPDIFRGDALANYTILKKMGVGGVCLSESSRLDAAKTALYDADLIIDAIFGTGLRDNVSDVPHAVIDLINESKAPALACDIPSGLSSYNGKAMGAAVKADATVTFGLCKLGLVLPRAKEYVGELVVADISLPAELTEETPARRELIDEAYCRRWLKPRDIHGHKGDYGQVTVIAGSKGMPGAAILAAGGAARMGAGKVSAVLPSACRSAFTACLPEALVMDVEDDVHGEISADSGRQIADAPCDAYVLGPGLGRSESAQNMIRELLPLLEKPAVLDADALFAVCGHLRLLKNAKAPLVITPHPGEMAKLLGVSVEDVQANRISVAEGFARQTNVVVVLKGAGTIVATPEGRVAVNVNGNPGMGTGGSGDVLSGMIATLLAQGLPAAAAAACAVWLHGKAGDIAAERSSQNSLLAGDLLDCLGLAYQALEIQ
ncbi:MAG: NAD(P)H-hydrate dehydratase [Firmicutes bacterium]|nr:NAD(P)H-hydrate dehydratase [Bacillota bacterium]